MRRVEQAIQSDSQDTQSTTFFSSHLHLPNLGYGSTLYPRFQRTFYFQYPSSHGACHGPDSIPLVRDDLIHSLLVLVMHAYICAVAHNEQTFAPYRVT